MSIDITDSEKKIVLPGAYLEVFSTHFEGHESEAEINHTKKQLGSISLKADCRDIYDNKITIQRDFTWFIRHM